MKYNKLVRDKIPDIIKAKGQSFVIHIADDNEYVQALNNKLIEEAREFAKDQSIEELADIYEVLEAIVTANRFNAADIKKVQDDKRQKRGGFRKRIILDESSAP